MPASTTNISNPDLNTLSAAFRATVRSFQALPFWGYKSPALGVIRGISYLNPA